MSVFIIDENTRAAFDKLKKHAYEKPFRLKELYRFQEIGVPVGTIKGFTITVPVGVNITYTIEQHPEGWMAHLSVSVDPQKKYPNEVIVNEIMKEMGFKYFTGHPETLVYLEEHACAVNVMEKIEYPLT